MPLSLCDPYLSIDVWTVIGRAVLAHTDIAVKHYLVNGNSPSFAR
jgi:hypothetical protein